ncbi:HAD family acid phosphatase [Subtercola vilae]|uniref:Polynucleotide kinase PNKP phosphatase domain-containing protein n=1 Tax=Subtercola vilae TaxID=2056433 RepID=A0A4T2BU28_9MICO|nr:HAD family acid phosphatase [Subtercola vilae]TIH34957.1 hypothetical protein D4765_11730 [Subtercola vilae]
METKPPAAIFDVDGTLADVSGVRHYVTGDPRKKDFEKFHAAASFAPANTAVVALASQTISEGSTVFVVTSRKERWRFRTAMWLRKWDVPHHYLMMRKDDDDRKDVEVKRDILARIQTHFDVILAVDDNPNVIALWEEKGIPTVVIPGWDASLKSVKHANGRSDD